MTATVNASTSAGVIVTSDTSGALALQTAGTTALTISSGQVVSLANALPATSGGTGLTSFTTNGIPYATSTSALATGSALNFNGTKLGINTASPNRTLTIANGGPVVEIDPAGISGTDPIYFNYNRSTSTYLTPQYWALAHIWCYNGGGEGMRLDSSGNLNINGTANNGAKVNIYCTDNVSNALNAQVFTNGNNAFGFKNASGSQVGTIGINASTTSYNTSSDYRLKENIAPMTGALDKVKSLKPITFDWIADKKASQGFIAHELQKIVPDCVNGSKDEVDADGNPRYQGIDTSFLVATLTSAIQELSTQLTELKAEVATLRGA